MHTDANASGNTIEFSVDKINTSTRMTLISVYNALKEKGYNPVNQMVGYLMSGDPAYITTYKNARSLILKIDRDDLLEALLRNYLGLFDK